MFLNFIANGPTRINVDAARLYTGQQVERHMSGELAGDTTYLAYGGTFSTEGEISWLPVLKQHLQKEHLVGWSISSMRRFRSDRSTTLALRGDDQLDALLEREQLKADTLTAIASLTHHINEKPPFLWFSIYLDDATYDRAERLLLEARRMEAEFLVFLEFAGIRSDASTYPTPSLKQVLDGAALYGFGVKFQVRIGGP